VVRDRIPDPVGWNVGCAPTDSRRSTHSDPDCGPPFSITQPVGVVRLCSGKPEDGKKSVIEPSSPSQVANLEIDMSESHAVREGHTE